MPNKRDLSGKQRAIAVKLKHIWLRKKRELNLTQVKAAKKLKVTQGAITQYLNGFIPLNTDMILAFAELLEVPPNAILPGILNNVQHGEIKVTSTTSGSPMKAKDILKPALNKGVEAIYIDDPNHNYMVGEYVLYSTTHTPEKGVEIVEVINEAGEEKIIFSDFDPNLEQLYMGVVIGTWRNL